MGIVADRLDKRLLVVTGGLILSVSVLMIGWAQGFRDLFIANLIFGIGGGISMPSLMALAVISGHKAEAMGAVMSLITVAHSLGMFCGSLLGGIIMDLLKLRYAFTFGALTLLGGTMMFVAGEYFVKNKNF